MDYSFGEMRVYQDAPTYVQPKLTISQPGDRYEREADRAADMVMRTPEPEVQRQAVPEEEEEEELLQAKPLVQRQAEDGKEARSAVPSIVSRIRSVMPNTRSPS